MNRRKAGIVLGMILIMVVVISGLFVWKNNQEQKSKENSQNLGAQIYSQLNPVEEKLPQTNPFAVETNPYKIVYPNPFK